MNDLPSVLGVSLMSISRSIKELEEIGIFKTYKKGVSKFAYSPLTMKEAYEKALPYLRSPIKRKGYILRKDLPEAPKAGLTALSEKGILSNPEVETYALSGKAAQGLDIGNSLTDADREVEIEIWSYDPSILAKDGLVDVLSLHQSLLHENDPRIEQALDETLGTFWSKGNA